MNNSIWLYKSDSGKTYHLFISHSWSYSDQYNGLVKLLEKDSSFTYKDYSIPKDDPVHTGDSDEVLYEAIKNKISRSSIVLILAGVYSSYSKWIDKEIEIANNEFSNKKPILGIKPWAQVNISTKVKNNADKIVGWNSSSIISAIKELCD